MAKECPLLDSVKSSNGSRPPGLPSHAVDIDFEAHEKLADQEDEVLHELEFNATHLHTHQGVDTNVSKLRIVTNLVRFHSRNFGKEVPSLEDYILAWR